MGYTLTLRKDAELDVGAHFEFYEEKREGLGHDFLLCLEEALDKVQRNPLNYRKIHKEWHSFMDDDGLCERYPGY